MLSLICWLPLHQVTSGGGLSTPEEPAPAGEDPPGSDHLAPRLVAPTCREGFLPSQEQDREGAN